MYATAIIKKEAINLKSRGGGMGGVGRSVHGIEWREGIEDIK